MLISSALCYNIKVKFPKYLTTVTPLSKYLAMFLFITMPFVGFYLGVQYQKSITVKPIQLTSSAIKPFQSSSDSWEIYTASDYSFKYPAENQWRISEHIEPLGKSVGVSCYPLCKNSSFEVFSVGRLIYKSFDEYKASVSAYQSDIQDTTINGEPAVVSISVGGPPGGLAVVSYFVIHNGLGYEISYQFSISNRRRLSDYPKPIPDILSTFKFTN